MISIYVIVLTNNFTTENSNYQSSLDSKDKDSGSESKDRSDKLENSFIININNIKNKRVAEIIQIK